MIAIQQYFKRYDNQYPFVFSLLTSLFLGNATILYYNHPQDANLNYYLMVGMSFTTVFFYFLFFQFLSVFKTTTCVKAFFNSLWLFLLIEFSGGSFSFAMYVLSFPSENGFLLDIIFAVFGGAFGALIFMIQFIPGTLLFALCNTLWVVTYERLRKRKKSI